MSVVGVRRGQPGKEVLLSGNEAIARGAVEAGVQVAAAYPGSPSSEVLGTLGQVGDQFGLYAEWSVNEKVAVEVAAAASFAGLRSMTIMKPDGMNVALDFITAVSYSGCKGGMVVVLGDDPGAHSSSKEEDSRFLIRTAHLPILEPADAQEAKDMVKLAFKLSEKLKQPVVVRAVTRICHASGNVLIDAVAEQRRVPQVTPEDRFVTMAVFHDAQERKLEAAAQWAAKSGINSYEGRENAKTIIIADGPSYRYAREAVALLGLGNQVGILKLGMTWPLDEGILLKHLRKTHQVIFAEEIEPFTEGNVKALAAQHWGELGSLAFFGRESGHLVGRPNRSIGELDPDILTSVLEQVLGIPTRKRAKDYGSEARDLLPETMPKRELSFCAGCPHRASFWALQCALELDGRNGFVLGDIGCYTMGLGRTGYHMLKTVHCMGASVGLAGGFGKLRDFGFEQPTISVVGDSTFYHAVIPALINAKYNNSNFLTVVLDNGTTAMTGHQPHPGTGKTATGAPATRVGIEEVVGGLGISVFAHDPYDIEGTMRLVFDLLQQEGPRVLILRRDCALIAAKQAKKPRVYVDQKKCIGEDCGCNGFCSRVFGCPANIWEPEVGRARIDEAVCSGCGVCSSLCPQEAILVEEVV